jgi:aspartate-semialdehyde dehydrogenase
MKVAVVGATGLVGTKMLQILEERNFPVSELIPVASEKSIGKQIQFKNKYKAKYYCIYNEQYSILYKLYRTLNLT